MTLRFMRFCLIGVGASAVHFSVVSLLVPLGSHPLIANVAGFGMAFPASFSGHHLWSFPARRRNKLRASGRFFCVAIGGFLLNESSYWALLRFTEIDYRVSLVIVLAGVAVCTFLLARHWAFADAPV